MLVEKKVAEEAGVEPTKPVLQTSPGLKSGHPTGDDTLPSRSLARAVCGGHLTQSASWLSPQS